MRVISLQWFAIKSCVRLFYHFFITVIPVFEKTEWCSFMGVFNRGLSDFNVLLLSLPVTKEISYEDLKALVGKSQNLFLVDVRSKEELDKGRIPGSVHIPSELLLNAFPKREKKNNKVKILTGRATVSYWTLALELMIIFVVNYLLNCRLFFQVLNVLYSTVMFMSIIYLSWTLFCLPPFHQLIQ